MSKTIFCRVLVHDPGTAATGNQIPCLQAMLSESSAQADFAHEIFVPED